MLFLTLRIGKDYYALPAAHVVEIVPLVILKELPQAPSGVVGLFDLRGTMVPVIDLNLLATGATSRVSMNTRMALLKYPPDGKDSNLLGLIAEEMTDTFHAAECDFVETGVDSPRTPYLGPVIKHENRILQRVGVLELLPPELRDSLFQPLAG